MSSSFAVLLAVCASAVAQQSPFAFREISPATVELSEGGKPIFVYNGDMVLAPGFPDTMRRSCYLHPVYAPDGTRLTNDFDQDHPHHRGISWMWPEVTVDGKKGDMWELKLFQDRFVAFKAREAQAAQARLAVENGWFDGDRKIAKENVEIVAHAAADGKRVLDFVIQLEATDRPVQFAGTSAGKKGFGGFCMRFAPRDGGAKETVIRTDKGISKKDAVMKPHAWAEISGVFQGKPAGARIEDLPSNPGAPENGWLLRHGFGFLNVSYPGLEPVTLEPGKPLVLKYRVTLFSGPAPE
jgi:hypothetical protein